MADTGLRIAAWACLGLLAVLSLSPAEYMVRTTLGGHVEHAAAYACTTFVVGLAYRNRKLWWMVVALVAYAGLLEFLQRFSPGRHSAVEDWLASSLGVMLGGGILRLTGNIRARGGAGDLLERLTRSET